MTTRTSGLEQFSAQAKIWGALWCNFEKLSTGHHGGEKSKHKGSTKRNKIGTSYQTKLTTDWQNLNPWQTPEWLASSESLGILRGHRQRATAKQGGQALTEEWGIQAKQDYQAEAAQYRKRTGGYLTSLMVALRKGSTLSIMLISPTTERDKYSGTWKRPAGRKRDRASNVALTAPHVFSAEVSSSSIRPRRKYWNENGLKWSSGRIC